MKEINYFKKVNSTRCYKEITLDYKQHSLVDLSVNITFK